MKNYLKLIKKFPLRKIRNREENEAALEVITDLTIRENELTEDEREYFALLSKLCGEYESSVFAPVPDMTPQEVLLFLMETHDLRQVDIASRLDIPKTHISGFLNGDRSLSKEEVGKIAAAFGISPLMLLPNNYFESRKAHKSTLSTEPIWYRRA
jgi:antitoxin component HigA of HigAB toxin-antitoxin module